MKVLICNGCWTPNIGNAFVNLGIEQIVRKSFPECEIVYSADVSNRWYFTLPTNSNEYVKNNFDISTYYKVDLVVWGGMMLTKEFVDIVGNLFLKFAERGIPIIFLGAGADTYSLEERAVVADFLGKIEKVGIITRDDDSYNSYAEIEDLRWKIVKGIDAAFFVSDMKIPDLEGIEAYDVECFDRIPVPYINHGERKVITSHHDPYGYLPIRYINREDTLVSELPMDYLSLYKNVRNGATYAERVHACIATLAFGNKAQLFTDTLRASLFEKVLDASLDDMKAKPVEANMDKMQKEKEKMIHNFQTMYYALSTTELYEKDELAPELLQVYIETIGNCNRRCPYCYFVDGSKEVKIMSEDTFERIIQNLEKMNYSNLIYLYDINEPLLDNRMPKFIKMISERLPNAYIYIFSNGDLATEELVEEYFDNGLHHFVFSLHDHSNDEKIQKIISKIGKDKFTIADMTVLKTEEFVNRGGSIKSEKIASQEKFLENICYLPFRQVLINPDGDYRLCCSIRDEVILGNIYETDIETMFFEKNTILDKYRQKLKAGDRKELYPCENCSFQGDNEIGIKVKLGKNYKFREKLFKINSEGYI